MRRELSKSVSKEFAKKMADKLPHYRPEKGRDNLSGRGVYLFSHVTDGCKSFVSLQIANNWDAFTVEFAWSRHGRWPVHLLPARPIDLPERGWVRGHPVDGEYRFRIGELWLPQADQWWVLIPKQSLKEFLQWVEELDVHKGAVKPVPEEAMQKVGPLVDHAIEKILQYAIPYFHVNMNL